jgi:Ca2+-binding EF-hand superfamily protein
MMSSSLDKELVLDKLRSKCLKKSCGALKQLGCIFRKMDIDFSKKICFEEMRKGIETYGVDFTETELRTLFDAFDKVI